MAERLREIKAWCGTAARSVVVGFVAAADAVVVVAAVVAAVAITAVVAVAAVAAVAAELPRVE
jgi:hypothetical protein